MTLKSYPFFRIALFFIPGIATCFLSSVSLVWIASLACVSLLLFFAAYFRKSKVFLSVCSYSLFFCLGYLIAAYHKLPEAFTIPSDMEAYTVRVKSAVESKPNSYKLTAEVLNIRKNGQWKKNPMNVLLYFQKGETKAPVYGDIFLIHNAPREIEPPKNPYEFDYKTFQQYRAVYAHHFLRKGDYTHLGYLPQHPWKGQIYAWNSRAGEILKNMVATKENYGIAEAMITGTRDNIEMEINNAYAATGAVHVLAVSGMHVGILLVMLQFLLAPIRNMPHGRYYFGIVSNAIIWLYAMFTGLTPSVVRATFMFSLYQLGEVFYQGKNSLNILAASAVILLIIQPSWLFDVGFQLSYLAIFGILFLYQRLKQLAEPKNKIIAYLWEVTMVSVAAQIFTFPLMLYYFHQFPNYALLSNPVVAIGSSIILFAGIPAVLLSQVPYLNTLLGKILTWTLTGMNTSVKVIADLPYSLSTGFSIEPVEVFIIFVILLLFIHFLIQKEPKLLVLSLLLSLFLFGTNVLKDFRQMKQQEIAFHFIPRGSGVSIIDSKNAVFLCDSATAKNSRAYAFHLKNYYDARGIRTYRFHAPADSSGMVSFNFAGTENLWIRKQNRKKIRQQLTRVMISNNAVWDLERQFDTFPRFIILDDTNTRKRIQTLQTQADSLGIPLISLYNTGGVILSH